MPDDQTKPPTFWNRPVTRGDLIIFAIVWTVMEALRKAAIVAWGTGYG